MGDQNHQASSYQTPTFFFLLSTVTTGQLPFSSFYCWTAKPKPDPISPVNPTRKFFVANPSTLSLTGHPRRNFSARVISVPSKYGVESPQCHLGSSASWSSRGFFCVWCSLADTLCHVSWSVPAGVAKEGVGRLQSPRHIKKAALVVWRSEALQLSWMQSGCEMI